MIFKRIRRFWAKLIHKHDWQTLQIMKIHSVLYPEMKYHAVLERCFCGKERAYYFSSAKDREKIDPKWFRLEADRLGFDIPEEAVLGS